MMTGGRPSVGKTMAEHLSCVRYRPSTPLPKGTKIQSKPAFAAFSLTAFQRRSRSAREYSAHIGTLAPALAGGFGGT